MRTKPSTVGFTLIEMIVSLALFSVVITISVGALLVLIASNRQLQDEQAVLANLSFALDSMTREIRTGSAYVCNSASNVTFGNPNPGTSNPANHVNPYKQNHNLDFVFSATDVNDCAGGRDGSTIHGVSFVESGDSITGSTNQRIVYFHDSNPDGDNGTEDGALYRRVGTGAAQKITSSGVAIVDADFFVTGSDPLSAASPQTSPNPSQASQPAVTVYLEAQVAGAANPKTYPIQTTIVQRGLDL